MSLSQTNFPTCSFLSSSNDLRIPYSRSILSYPRHQTHRILCAAKRTGKRRYPSERKKLRTEQKEAVAKVKNKLEGVWRLSKLGVPVGDDPGKDSLGISPGLLQAIAKVIEFPVSSPVKIGVFGSGLMFFCDLWIEILKISLVFSFSFPGCFNAARRSIFSD